MGIFVICMGIVLWAAYKAGTFAPSARAKKGSNVAQRPPIDEEMDRLIWKIARDRADIAMSELKSNLRRVYPKLIVPPTERHRIDEEMEKLTSKIARDRADMLMSQRKHHRRRVSPNLSVPKTEGHREVDR